MKKIQRYTAGTADPEAIVKDNKGWLVSYSDYAALKAENERLRKAGDAMADEFKFIGGGTVEGWHKAKGVQS